MIQFCLLAGALAMAACQYIIFLYAPVDAAMGLTQKIFYLHLPLAWWGLISFLLVFCASIVFLKTRSERAKIFSRAAGEVGELCCLLTVCTGMIWGKTAWGVWWTWDPRLTTALVLCFIYAGWLLLHNLDLAEERRATICAVTGILAFLDVPLVFFSARIWRSIHPAVFSAQGAAMPHEMLLTTLLCIAAFGLFWLGLIGLRMQLLRLEATKRKLLAQSLASQA